MIEISRVAGETGERGCIPKYVLELGIYVTMPGRSSDKNHLHDIIISNNYVHDVFTSGIRVNQQEDFINDIHHTHVVVRNRIERTGSDGIIGQLYFPSDRRKCLPECRGRWEVWRIPG